MSMQDIYLINQFVAVVLYFLPALVFVGAWRLIVYIAVIVKRNRHNKGLETLEDCRESVLQLEGMCKDKDRQIKALRAKVAIYERQVKAVSAAMEIA